ncbi:hypothetical protein FS837_010372 [Tulasnella sp. UAMH 9824]|nr:hypothetical protein FS837_010372 [Tulasnella sp. UAMH 9824]
MLTESVDWSVVLNHPRIKRKYGARTDSAASSRSSVSSGLTEQFSSSGSDSSSVEGNAHIGSPQREAENASSGLLGKARYILAKRRAKKLFIRFTTRSPTNQRVPGWRRREKAANGLLEIIEKEAEGEDLVGRRFTKTASRQERVTRAILSLSDEEYDRDVRSSGLGKKYFPLTVHGSGPAVRLLGIVIKHSKGSSFFEDSIPKTLNDEELGTAAILFLAATFPRFFELVDPRALFTYSSRILEGAVYSNVSWLRAIRLLDLLMSHIPPSLVGRRDIQLLVARAVIKEFVDFSSAPAPTVRRELVIHPLRSIIILQAIVSSLLQAEGNLGDLENILPPVSAMEDVIYDLKETATVMDPRGDTLEDIESALALKILALLRETSAGKRLIPEDDPTGLGATCMAIVLSKPKEKDQRKDGYGGIVRGSYLRTVDEDAFDLLCCLPQSVFAEALAFELSNSALGLKRDTDDPSDVLQLLDPLLWLSNMPPTIKEAYQALIDGGTCGFLLKIIDYPVSLVWAWQDRDVWRAKGQAITCLGNIIERMDEAQMRGHITKEMIEAVVTIKANEEAPLSERIHAKFTLQRYTTAADQCGIEPYYREEVQASN